MQRKKELLSSSGLDESDPEKLLDKVKERGQGQRARQELEQWTQLLIEYVDIQETAIERRRKLLSLLDQSCIFYKVRFNLIIWQQRSGYKVSHFLIKGSRRSPIRPLLSP